MQAQELTDPEALKLVTDEDLKEMSIGTIGARRKILAGIRKLNECTVVIVPKSAEALKADVVGEMCAELGQVCVCALSLCCCVCVCVCVCVWFCVCVCVCVHIYLGVCACIHV